MNRIKKLASQISDSSCQVGRAFRYVWTASPAWMILSLITQLLQGIFPVLSLYLLKLMVDQVVLAAGGEEDYAKLILIIVLTGGVTLLTRLIGIIGSWSRREQGRFTGDYMNGVILEKAAIIDYEFYENPTSLNSLHRALQESQYRPGQIVDSLAVFVQNLISLSGVVVIIAGINPLIVLILFAAALPGLVNRLFFSNREYLNERNSTEKERRAGYFQFLMLERDSAKEVRLYNLSPVLIGEFQKLRAQLRNIRHGLDVRNTLFSCFSSFFMVVLIFTAYVLVAGRVVTGSLSVGAFIMFYQAFQRGQEFLQQFLGGLASLYSNNLFLGNLFQFLDTPVVIKPETKTPAARTVPRGEIEFRNVSFSYPGTDKKIISRLDLTLNPGEVVALVGLNGCGKTTLVKLLCRLYDVNEGAIFLDGEDIRTFDITWLRENVGVIFQDYIEYNLSARENIFYGQFNRETGKTDEVVHNAAIKADAHDMIKQLGSGYDTTLGVMFQQGEELSGGQWQKIAMARAFYKEAPVLILDEPTSSLDPMAEYDVFCRIKSMVRNKTALLVSHRMATVRMADRICVMDKGRIAEEGGHDKLMQEKGLYYDLFTTQAKNYL